MEDIPMVKEFKDSNPLNLIGGLGSRTVQFMRRDETNPKIVRVICSGYGKDAYEAIERTYNLWKRIEEAP